MFSKTNTKEDLMTAKQSKGGVARAQKLDPKKRSDIASKAAKKRWEKLSQPDIQVLSDPIESLNHPDLVDISSLQIPEARYRGYLPILGSELPCYVLDNGQRVIGRTSTTEFLSGIKGGGALEQYISVKALRSHINLESVVERMVEFHLPEVKSLGKAVKGLPADLVIEICQAFVAALEESLVEDSKVKLTFRQTQIAVKASMFLSACAKVGLDSLIDEATGYQYVRAEDALKIKLNLYLEEEMRKWEKTFPDELWVEFGRLTRWKGKVSKRPKYWGKLVMELIYGYLDSDVSRWLKENAPTPRHGQNYHQWLSSQYGLKKLVEHIWMVIGIAKTCENMSELRDKMGELYGQHPVQLKMYLPIETSS